MRLLETSLYLVGCGCLATLAALCAALCWGGPAPNHAWPLIWVIAITSGLFGMAGYRSMRRLHHLREALFGHISSPLLDDVVDVIRGSHSLPSNGGTAEHADSAAA